MLQVLYKLRDIIIIRHGARFAEWYLALSTYQARAKLKTGPISLLIDSSVLGHGVTHETDWVSTESRTSGAVDTQSGYLARIPVHRLDDDSELYRNIEYLAGIAHLARCGFLNLMTSCELLDEQFRQPIGRYQGYGFFDYSVFSGIQFESVDLTKIPTTGLGRIGLRGTIEQQHSRLSKSTDQLYLELLQTMHGNKISQDAWHIRTAEVHGLFCFLTMDFKLVRQMRDLKDKEPIRSLKTRVMTPKEFGAFLGLRPIPPIYLSYLDANGFVHPELTMPEGKRRPASKYLTPNSGSTSSGS